MPALVPPAVVRAVPAGAPAGADPGAAEPDARRRAGPRSLRDRLFSEPRRFSFDAAIRLLQRAARKADPTLAARFRSPPGLAFPPADVLALRPGEAGAAPRITVGLMGLTGPSGVLPRGYTDTVTTTLRDRSHALHDFLDLLSHRLVAFFAGAGAKYRPHRSAEQAALNLPLQADPTARLVISLAGYGTPHMADRLAVGSDPLLHYAGLFATRPAVSRTARGADADGLARSDRCEVVEFAGAWLSLPPADRSRLPRLPLPSGRSANSAGDRCRDSACGRGSPEARMMLRIGPLQRGRISRQMLPDREILAGPECRWCARSCGQRTRLCGQPGLILPPMFRRAVLGGRPAIVGRPASIQPRCWAGTPGFRLTVAASSRGRRRLFRRDHFRRGYDRSARREWQPGGRRWHE